MSHAGWSWLSCCLTLAVAPGEPFLDLSYEQALARSTAEDKLLVADFTATWCLPCKKMEKDTWPAESVRAWLAEHALAIQIDVDEQSELVQSLKIEAMPTVIAFKGGEEFDRIVGYRGPDELQGWLEGVRAGRRAVDALREKEVELEASQDVEARYALARGLLQHHEYERALKQYLWLWSHSRSAKGYGGVRLSFMLSDIQRLCDAHAPAQEAFVAILAEVDAMVGSGRADEYEQWAEWFDLSAALDDSARVITFYERQRNDQGRLGLARLGGFVRDYVTDEVFELLIEKQRYLDAARLIPDTEVKARTEIVSCREMRELYDRLYADDPERLAEMQEFQRRGLQRWLSRLHAAALILGQPEQAQTIGRLLVEEYDDADSRLALVCAAVQFERAGAEHGRWLDEAELKGADVSALRAKLAEMMPAPDPAAPAEGR